MIVKEFGPEYYPQISEFWKQYDWVAPSEQVLPKKGYIAFDKDKPIAAAFVYLSCSGMALLDWVIADKEAESLKRGRAVHLVIEACKAYSISQGKKVLYTVTGNVQLKRTYEKLGFKIMESLASTLALSLDETSLDFLRE